MDSSVVLNTGISVWYTNSCREDMEKLVSIALGPFRMALFPNFGMPGVTGWVTFRGSKHTRLLSLAPQFQREEVRLQSSPREPSLRAWFHFPLDLIFSPSE